MNDIDTGSLFRFFHRFVNPYKGSDNVFSKEQLTNGSEQFSNLLNNMRLIAQEISPSFFNLNGLKHNATVDFYIEPWFSQRNQSAQLAKNKETVDEVCLHAKARTGGYKRTCF